MNREQHLLTKLSEECNEVGQVCSKIISLGLFNCKPGTRDTNKQRLIEEINDVLAVLNMIESEIFNTPIKNSKLMLEKIDKVNKYYKVAQQLGNVKNKEYHGH